LVINREEALIVGAGPIGLACAISAKRRGVDPLVIDAGALADSIVRFPRQMIFFTTPDLLEIGGHPFPCSGEKPTRGEALKYYRGIARAEGIRVRSFTRLIDAETGREGVACRVQTRTGADSILAGKLVLATGYYDNPNLLGVSGEDLHHVSHYFDEGHMGYGLPVVVVGGGNSAVEAALDLYRSGARVTLVHRGPSLKKSVKYWMRPDAENRIGEGSITARFERTVVCIDEEAVFVRSTGGEEERIAADRVYLLTGYHPDADLFARIGIRIDPKTGRPEHDPETLESNVPGVHLAGSIVAGFYPSEVFIENGRFDGDKIFR